MTWHLKDRELENKLIAIDTDFIERLNQNCEIWDSNHDGDLCELMHFEQILRYKNKLIGNLLFTGVQLEEVPEYNPNGWNEFPAVTPPDSRVCQLTVSHSLDEPIKYFAAFYDFRAKTWRVQDSGRQIDTKVLKDGFVAFRPWRD